jgi:hypothetical protein
VLDTATLDEEEANATVNGQLLSSIVGVVLEIVLDEAGLSSLYELMYRDKNLNLLLKRNLKSVLRSQKDRPFVEGSRD